MNTLLKKILRNVPRAIREPKRAVTIVQKRLLPFAVLANDPDAYQIISSWTFGKLPRVRLTELFPGIDAVNVTILRAFDRTPEVSLSTAEILVLAAMAKFMQSKRILEIGTFDGNTTLNLAANSPSDASVTTIDLPPSWNGKLMVEVPKSMFNVTSRSEVGRQFRATEYSDKMNQVFGDSSTINWRDLPIPFDLVFIDGCHYYQYVKLDTQNALIHLKRGGLLVWHDYGIIEDVSRAVDETAERIRVSAIRGTTLAVGFVD